MGESGGGGGGAKVLNYKHEPSQNSCTQHIVFVTIYISKEISLVNNLYSTSLTNLILSSLVSEF